MGAELEEVGRTVGFFQVTGHGVPDEVAEPAWRLATEFFDLPLEDKLGVGPSRRSGVRLGNVVAAVVRGINPHPDDRSRGGVAEPLVGRYPPGGRPGRLGVPAPLPGGTRSRGAGGTEPRQVRDCRGRLVHVPRAQHRAHPPVQLVKVELAKRVVLAEHRDQPFAVGVGYPRAR